MSAETRQATVTTEIQRHGETLPPHCLQKLPILCLLLATLSCGYLKNICKSPVPAANRLGRNFQIVPKWASSIKHRKRNCHLSRVRTLPTVSSHQGALIAALNPWPDITGFSDSPQTSTGTAKAGAGWAENCPAPGTGCPSGPDFSPWKPVWDFFLAFLSGSIHHIHWFLLQAATSHFTPLWFWFLLYLLMLPSKECNWCI